MAAYHCPFPGMDPYLEDPALWGDVHHTLISALRRHISERLPEGYIALIQERVYLETLEGRQQYLPDVSVGVVNREAQGHSPAGAAVADAPVHIALHTEPVREPFIEIYSLHAPERTLVSVIEILSPTNKLPHSEGRRLYLRKQRDLLNSAVHLLEIDLLHAGAHTVFLPLEALQRARAAWDYLICLHRAGWTGCEADVWFVDLTEPMPAVWLPLRAPDADLVVHLQAAFEDAYREGQYHKVVDYRQPPPVSLPAERLAWVEARLRKKGLRWHDGDSGTIG
ncbi:MAG: DUF4058 family protein [Fimbriimonadales bacterium]